MVLDHRRPVRDGEVAEALLLALRVDRLLGGGVERRGALVEDGEEGPPVAVALVPVEVPEEAAEPRLGIRNPEGVEIYRNMK